jgi:hypothetical protein
MSRILTSGVGVVVLANLLALAPAADSPAPKDKPAVVELFEDDDAAFIPQLSSFDGPNPTAKREERDVYAGFRSLRVTPNQRYNPSIPGWNFVIAEKPGPGQYRYLRFAWKKIGGKGIMLQLCSKGQTWEGQRYVAGENVVGWAGKIIADKPPAEWTVVTRDLFKDFGPIVLTGIAFTPMDGDGLYDHLYLGRTVEDLDKIGRVGLGVEALKDELTREKLLALWDDLADDARSVRAQRTLYAASRQSVPLFKERLRPAELSDDEKQIAKWIAALDDDEFQVREEATKKLEKLGAAAVPALQRARDKAPLEAQRRIDGLLEKAGKAEVKVSPEQLRTLRAIQVLERVGEAEARQVLQTLAKGAAEAEATMAAKAALERLVKSKE